METVKIRGLRKRYKGREVLRGLDMTLEQGDIYGFIGQNGAGKSTTMNIICDIISKDAGEVRLSHPSGKKLKIGYLPETPLLFPYMYAEEYLMYIAKCGKYPEPQKRIQEVLKLSRLDTLEKKLIKTYSRGMNQRLGIAAILLNKPDLIILDEPTSALDPAGRADVMDIIETLASGRDSNGERATVILCTHILADIERVANKVGILVDGTMVREGTIDEVVGDHDSDTGTLTIKVSNPNIEQLKVLRTVPQALSSDIQSDGTIILTSKDPEALKLDVMKIMLEHGIIPDKIETEKRTLEQLYLELTRGGKIV